jgi:hypothetical protein
MNEFRQSLVSVALACMLVCVPSAWSRTGSDADEHSHFIAFPEKKIGDIALVPTSPDMFMALLSSKLRGQGAACGMVKVPPKQQVFLFASYDLAEDTSKLNQFHSNDFVGISFYKMPLEDEGLKNVSRLSGLQKLDLRYTDVTDAGLQDVAKLNNLISLDLTATMIKGPGLRSLTAMKSLEAVDLSKNKFGENWLKALTPMPNLKHLKMRRCDLTDKSFDYIDKMPGLGELDVSENPHVTSQGLARLAGAKKLISLNVVGTGIRPEDLDVVKQIPNLQSLSIGGPRFDNHVIAAWVKAMPHTKVLPQFTDGYDVPVSIFRPLH